MSSISSVSVAVPVKSAEVSEPKAPELKADGDSNDTRNAAPPAQAPLLPGQGTRIDVIA